ncbi:MAG: TrbI/VirB10 family protein [Luteimonas sp.]
MSADSSTGTHGERLPGSSYAWHPKEAAELDAAEPLLRSSDIQRLNRKAIAFLAGIVALLVASVIWMASGSKTGTQAASRPAEKVVIPELPQARPDPGVPPIPVAPMPVAQPQSVPTSQALRSQGVDAPAAQMPGVGTSAPHEPSLRERREGASVTAPTQAATADPYTQALLAGMPPPPPGVQAPVATTPVRNDASEARNLQHPDALLVRGTFLRCVLETRIVTDIPGFTSCVVTEPVYSINGRNMLVPKGSKISGRYDSDANGPRIAVTWDRITTPTGLDVRMASPGVDNLGGAGHPGDYDAHWPARAGAALMISLISDVFKYEGETHGPRSTTISNGLVTQAPFESNTARSMERLANMALDRSVNRPATVTINQGTVVNVYVAKDVDFAAVLPR